MKNFGIVLLAALGITSAFGASPTRLNDAVIKNQLSIGTTSVASTSAVLDLVSTTKGFNPPRMTTTQRDAISSPTAGLTIYNTTTSALNAYSGTAWVAVGSGTGAGIENMVTNGNAETDTTGWATFADAAANRPVDGTGGSATNLTFSRSTSSPLNGVGSFTMVQTNATSIQGKGVSYDYTLDSAYQGRTMSVQFNFNASSTFVASNGVTAPLNDGTTTTNAGNSDVEVFMYDVTNAVLLPMSPQVIAANGANNFTFKGTFQTSSNSTSYRFILMAATASANATGWTFKWDNLVIGPQAIIQDTPLLNWNAYTPTISAGFGTTTNSSFFYRRVGDSVQVQGYFTAGTVAGSVGSISLPTGLALDTTKISVNNTSSNAGQIWGDFIADGSANRNGAIVTAPATSTTVVYYAANVSNTTALTPNNVSSNIVNSSNNSVRFTVPVSGWSSTVQMSNDASQRVVEASYYRSSTASNTANTQINFDSLIYDSHGAVTTGASWKFTAPVSGYYDVKCVSSTNNTGYSLRVYKNGSANQVITGVPNTSGYQTFGSSKISLVAGDTIDLRNDTTSNIIGATPSTGAAIVWISLDQGPTSLAVVDAVNMRYHGATATITGSDSLVTYSTKDFDTNGAYSSGTYTIPTSGKYQINASIAVQETTGTNSISIYKNGVQFALQSSLASLTGVVPVSVSDIVTCVAGDLITIQVNSTGSSVSVSASNVKNFLSISRLGN